MESGDGVRVKTAIRAEEFAGSSRAASSLEGVNLASSLGFDHREQGRRDHGLKVTKKMKIIQFPVNIDKLTGFFDKYLKSEGEGIEVIIEFYFSQL